MIIKASDFTNNTSIPNSNEIGAPGSERRSEVESYIEEFEVRFLYLSLGFEEADALITAFKESIKETDPVDLEDKYKKLINGDKNYFGLIKPCVNYIYFHYLNDDLDNYSSAKENSKSKSKNESNYMSKLNKSWKLFYEGTCGNYSKTILVKETGIGIFHNQTNFKSMYQYLSENKQDFPNWVPSNIQNTNLYGI